MESLSFSLGVLQSSLEMREEHAADCIVALASKLGQVGKLRKVAHVGRGRTPRKAAGVQARSLKARPTTLKYRAGALGELPAALTVTLRRGVAVSLSWSWSRQPQGRA